MRPAIRDQSSRLPRVTAASTGLVVFLVVYALVGVALAINVFGVSNRLAELYRRMHWLLRPIWGANPNVWRGGGVVMLAFGVTVGAWIVVSGVWQLPRISTLVAVVVLMIAAAACTGVLTWAWLNRDARKYRPGPKPREGS